jgi:hypothetical protein
MVSRILPAGPPVALLRRRLFYALRSPSDSSGCPLTFTGWPPAKISAGAMAASGFVREWQSRRAAAQ